MLRCYFFSDAGQEEVQSDDQAADDLPDPSMDIPARSGAAQAAGDGQDAKVCGKAKMINDLPNVVVY